MVEATWACRIGVTGKLTWPVVGSRGVIGGPLNVIDVGTVGENFIVVRRHCVCKAMQVLDVRDGLNTRCSGLARHQCQNLVAVCVSIQAPRGLVRHIPLLLPV